MKKSNRIFKMIAVTVILALVINLLPDIFGTYKAMADTTGGNEVPTYEGILRLTYGTDDSAIAEIPYKEELRQVGESEYEFTLSLDPVTMIKDQSEKNTSSKNGYFTAQIEGYYMVDIYGGKGGSGQSLIAFGCGYGGDRGHVYGAVYLKKGDTLVYSIGGNGATVSVKDATAGNGGSAHGEEGSKEIGSGGGFTAVYLFKAGESLAGYTDAQGQLNFDTIKEADRLSKLIMLAGGGGGGAADSSDINIFNTPNGGAGGNIDGSYVVVDDGIVFNGSNGISSSKTTVYRGEGGTTNPGRAVASEDGYYSEAGKDWTEGGTGGNSNFRGGGGGAGYNGGSGGIMKGKYEASDVGGGGGGASYISNVVLTRFSDSAENTPYSSLFSSEMPDTSYLAANETVEKNKNGGTFHIEAISANDAYSFLKNMTISFDNISEYFIVQTMKSTYIDAENKEKANGEVVLDSRKISGLSLIDDKGNGIETFIRVVLKPRAEFTGGNDVNLFTYKTNSTTEGVEEFNGINVLYDIIDENNYRESSISIDKNVGDEYSYVGYVNVPLNGYSLKGKTVSFNENEPDTIYSTSLIECNIPEKNSFIQNVSPVTLNDTEVGTTDEDKKTVVSFEKEGDITIGYFELALGGRTKIDDSISSEIKFTVSPVPTANKAKVGKVQNDKVYSSYVFINYIKFGSIEIDDSNETWITVSRELKYDANTSEYKYLLDADVDYTNRKAKNVSSNEIQPKSTDSNLIVISSEGEMKDGKDTVESKQYTISKAGWYYIALKGADGGYGALAGLALWGGTSKGGKGAIVKGYYYVPEDNYTITVSTHPVGAGHTTNYPGEGGKGSYVEAENVKIVGAAGGGGGECGNGSKPGDDGENAPGTSGKNTGLDGTEGGKKNNNEHPGYAGINIISQYFRMDQPSFVNTTKEEADKIIGVVDSKISKASENEDGACYIAPVEYLKYGFDNQDVTYTINEEISNYFEIESVSVFQDNVINPIVYKEGSEFSNNVIDISIPLIIDIKGYGIESQLSNANFRVEINLKPIEDFLGGLDVPVLNPLSKNNETITDADGNKQSVAISFESKKIYLKHENAIDYANVAINTTAINAYLSKSGVFETNDNQVYVKGYDSVKFSDVVKGTAAKTYFEEIDTLLDDFVSITEVAEPTDWNGAPKSDVNIPFTFKVEPTDKDGNKSSSKAAVVSNVEPFALTKYAKISVKSAAEFNLTNLYVNYTLEDAEVNNPLIPGETKTVKRYVFTPDGNDFKCILSTSGNYKLPLEENVQVNYRVYSGEGTDISSECTFNEFTGELTIPGKFFVNDSVVVNAEARKPDDLYKIVLEYQTAPESKVYDLYSDPEDTTDPTKGYLTDADISTLNPTTSKVGNDGNPLVIIPDAYGYNFLWEDGLYDSNGGITYGGICELPSKMPAHDIYIMGSYTPKTYKVVINYFDKGTTNPVTDAFTKKDYRFGQTIEVVSPTNITGKKPEVLKVTKTLNEAFLKNTDECTLTTDPVTNENVVTINVYYVAAESELTVMFVKEDGVTQMTDIKDSTRSFDTITEKITAGTDYSYDLSIGSGETGTLGKVYTVEGYKTFINPSSINYEATTSETTINGTMDANGRTVKVVYVGDQVELRFNWSEGPDILKFNNLAKRYVQYGGYISDTWNGTNYKTYQSLPSLADIDGWHFKGWKMSGVTGYVGDGQIVNLSSSIELIADWEQTDITIHVYYRETKYGTTLGHEDISAQAGVPEKITFSPRTGYTLNYPSEGFYVLNPETNKYEFSVTANNDKYVYVEFTINSYSCQYQWIVLDSEGKPMTVPGDATTGISLDDDGKTTPKNVYSTGNVDYNEGYSYVAPANPFYSDEDHKDQFRKSVTQGPTSGNMPVGGVLIIITYTEVAPDAVPELICVTVTWENLDFVYSSGTWDPDTHSTGGASFVWDSESKSAAKANPKITVTNVELTATETGISDFTQPTVHAEFGYTKNTGFGDVNGSFSNNALDVYKGGSEDVTFTLSGKMNSSLKPGDVRKVGKVTVTISRSDK